MKSLIAGAWEILSSMDGSELSDAKQATAQMANSEKEANSFHAIKLIKIDDSNPKLNNLVESKIYHGKLVSLDLFVLY